MRLLPYILLAYIALGVQSGLGVLWTEGGSSPNLVLIAAIFIATHATRSAALLGCFCMGLMQDLLTLQPLGLYAFSYGLIALMLIGSQPALKRANALVHILTALFSATVVMLIVLINQFFLTPAGEPHPGAWPMFKGVLLTTLLAPLLLWLLHKTRKAFVFDSGRWRT